MTSADRSQLIAQETPLGLFGPDGKFVRSGP
jgi:hypothetical protein